MSKSGKGEGSNDSFPGGGDPSLISFSSNQSILSQLPIYNSLDLEELAGGRDLSMLSTKNYETACRFMRRGQRLFLKR